MATMEHRQMTNPAAAVCDKSSGAGGRGVSAKKMAAPAADFGDYGTPSSEKSGGQRRHVTMDAAQQGAGSRHNTAPLTFEDGGGLRVTGNKRDNACSRCIVSGSQYAAMHQNCSAIERDFFCTRLDSLNHRLLCIVTLRQSLVRHFTTAAVCALINHTTSVSGETESIIVP